MYFSPSTSEPVRFDVLARVAVLIPARNPGAALPALVRALRQVGVGRVVVVDDGSAEECAGVFAALGGDGVEVLRHPRNRGKGRALKTGFAALLREHASIEGVVTADGDGQHTAEDIVAVARALAGTMTLGDRRVVLGTRSFEGGVPLRSRFGNTVTRLVLAMISGQRVRDTQTGLRGFPRAVVEELLTVQGERYEYEMNVLLHVLGEARKGGPAPLEVPIATVYIEGNRTSHFDPVLDSMRIYFVLLRYAAAAVLSAALDFAGFAAVWVSTHELLLAVVVGRLSSLVNFAVNRRFVFRRAGADARTVAGYYGLAVVVAGASYGLIRVLEARLGVNVFVAKVMADALLSLVSFSVQRVFIFARGESAAG